MRVDQSEWRAQVSRPSSLDSITNDASDVALAPASTSHSGFVSRILRELFKMLSELDTFMVSRHRNSRRVLARNSSGPSHHFTNTESPNKEEREKSSHRCQVRKKRCANRRSGQTKTNARLFFSRPVDRVRCACAGDSPTYRRAPCTVRVNHLFMSQDEEQINSIKGTSDSARRYEQRPNATKTTAIVYG